MLINSTATIILLLFYWQVQTYEVQYDWFQSIPFSVLTQWFSS